MRQVLGKELPPGPHLPRAVQTCLFWRWPFEYLEQSSHRHGSRFTLRPTSRPPPVFLSDPADIKAMFAAPADVLHPGEGGAIITPIVGDQIYVRFCLHFDWGDDFSNLPEQSRCGQFVIFLSCLG